LLYLVTVIQPDHSLFPYTTLFRSPGQRGVHLPDAPPQQRITQVGAVDGGPDEVVPEVRAVEVEHPLAEAVRGGGGAVVGDVRRQDRKSTRLNSSHVKISYAVFCVK